MFQVTAFSIVFALLASPSAAVVCRAWCDRIPGSPVTSNSGCHHGTAPAASPTVQGAGSCDGSLLSAIAFVREPTVRLAVAPGAHLATPVACYRFVGLTGANGLPNNPATQWTFEKQPLPVALRI